MSRSTTTSSSTVVVGSEVLLFSLFSPFSLSHPLPTHNHESQFFPSSLMSNTSTIRFLSLYQVGHSSPLTML